jgi:hypothetical protein
MLRQHEMRRRSELLRPPALLDSNSKNADEDSEEEDGGWMRVCVGVYRFLCVKYM